MGFPPLIVATRNAAKIGAFRRALPGIVILPFPDEIDLPVADESGADLAAIASAKAITGSQALGDDRLVIASDGGLLVPGLGSVWDPSRTRRFAGAEATDVDRANALIELAAHLTGEERRVGWVEAVAIASAGEIVGCWSAEGTSGLLAPDVDAHLVERGGGFWVQAVWIAPEHGNRRLAELTPEEIALRPDYWTDLGRQVLEFLGSLPPA